MDTKTVTRHSSREARRWRRPHVAMLALLALCTPVLGTAGPGRATGQAGLRLTAAKAVDSTQATLPPFHWSVSRAADHYEFELAADRSFSSPVLSFGGHFTTRNTVATVDKAVPDGTYWWRVRAVSKSGGVSGWSVGSVTKRWSSAPALLAPASGRKITYPRDPLVLTWRPVAGAAKYRVALASDKGLASLVGGRATETGGTSFVPPLVLADRPYYWAVTPLDAQGNVGAQSAVRSFSWEWPSRVTTHFADLADAAEVVDPQLSWDPVPGAARYELDVNFSKDFAPGSRVCCSTPVVATSYSPTKLLPNNTYYWRVRAINASGKAGDWSEASFTKTFDTAPTVSGPSIKGLRVRDNYGNTVTGGTTSVPILAWDPVPGASAYEVYVARRLSTGCVWPGQWHSVTAVPAWTPLGVGGTKPFPAPVALSSDATRLTSGVYCARVRALADTSESGRVYGDFTELQDAFSYAPAGTGGGSADAGMYLSPPSGSVNTQTPLFTWRPVAGATGYYVLVARDSSFTTVVDYAYTQIPAYAPRKASTATTYADETTSYYWTVIPAGQGSPGSYVQFEKRSEPPKLLGPAANAVVGAEQPVFHWTPVLGARNYRLQVSTDPKFGGQLLDDLETASTAYSSNTTYPPQTKLYWRVRANDETDTGLTWSDIGSFRHVLPPPTRLRGVADGDLIPLWRWQPTGRAVAYDLHATKPNGSTQDFTSLPTPAVVATLMAGTGVFRWQVRAEFPKGSYGTTSGPYSGTAAFTRTIHAPTGARALVGGRSLLFTWQPKLGVEHYRVELASTADFSRVVDRGSTDGPAYAPQFRYTFGLAAGKPLYWRVAAVDAYGNVGSFTKAAALRVPWLGGGRAV